MCAEEWNGEGCGDTYQASTLISLSRHLANAPGGSLQRLRHSSPSYANILVSYNKLILS